ncbi:MAG: GTP-binding protein [Candidatus Paceibacterota bacterium]|jgi:sulfate adenylyltransferase subunit 1
MENKEFVIVATSGSVDDGKSTLLGRLLYDCDSIYQDVLKTLKKDYESEDVVVDNLAYVTDGLEAEREQGITIDVAYKHFSRTHRKFLLVDVPGHEQYTRNMITGVSRADAVVIMIDMNLGVSIQSKRHFFIASMLGVKNIIFALNKMDLMGFKQEIFEKVKSELEDYSTKLNVSNCIFIPMSAKYGDMVVARGERMNWYEGPTLLSVLETFSFSEDLGSEDFRLPVQCVLNDSNFRGYAGKVEAGVLNVGDKVTIVPSGKKTSIKEIYIGFDKVETASKGQSIAVSVNDKLDISRGDIIIGADNSIVQSNNLDVILFWFDEKSLKEGRDIILKNNTKDVRGTVQNIEYSIDMNTTQKIEKVGILNQNDVGKASIKLNSDIFFDTYAKNKNMGSFILIDDITYDTIGAGIILGKKDEK